MTKAFYAGTPGDLGKERLKRRVLKRYLKTVSLRRRRDILRQSVPQPGSSDWKSSVADGWKTECIVCYVSVYVYGTVFNQICEPISISYKHFEPLLKTLLSY